MNRLLFPDYESLSRAAAEQIIKTVAAEPEASICLATGATPTRTYEILCEAFKPGEACFAATSIVKLDEWGGLPENHPSTCEHYLRKHVIEPLQIQPQQYLSFRSAAADPEAECARVRQEFAAIAPLDLCVLGLGINGHLGFNEPAEALIPHAHIAKLTKETQRHRMVAATETKPSFGYTLGMADLLQARKVLLLVSGNHKKAQLERLLAAKIETGFPASFLWLHANLELYCDIS